jgi:hypothetical protein
VAFCVPEAGWKKLLQGSMRPEKIETQRGFVKTLLDRITLDISITDALDLVINQAEPIEAWRHIMVKIVR